MAQFLIPDPGVLLLVAGGLQKQLRQLLVALLLGHQRKVGVLVPGLALTGEGLLQVLLCLGARIGRGSRRGSLLHLFKSRRGLFADRALEVRRKFITLVDVAANLAFPLCHVFCSSLF